MAEKKTPQGLIVGLIEPTEAPEQESSPAQEATADKPKKTSRKTKETE